MHGCQHRDSIGHPQLQWVHWQMGCALQRSLSTAGVDLCALQEIRLSPSQVTTFRKVAKLWGFGAQCSAPEHDKVSKTYVNGLAILSSLDGKAIKHPCAIDGCRAQFRQVHRQGAPPVLLCNVHIRSVWTLEERAAFLRTMHNGWGLEQLAR